MHRRERFKEINNRRFRVLNRALLHVILNICDRSYIVVPAPERVVSHEEDEHARPYDAAPIHVARCRVGSSREELEHPEHREKAQCDDVDRVAGFAKVKARSWEGFSAESLVEDTWVL